MSITPGAKIVSGTDDSAALVDVVDAVGAVDDSATVETPQALPTTPSTAHAPDASRRPIGQD
jgi:hypothetical protein